MPVEEEVSTPVKPKVVPTVGRMVYYKSYGTPNGEFPSVDRAAVVTDVSETNGSYMCRLAVLNPEGLFFSQWLMQGDKPGQWDWMPFQKDQQARLAPGTEVLTNTKGEAISAA